jgi:hypothetical protein
MTAFVVERKHVETACRSFDFVEGHHAA